MGTRVVAVNRCHHWWEMEIKECFRFDRNLPPWLPYSKARGSSENRQRDSAAFRPITVCFSRLLARGWWKFREIKFRSFAKGIILFVILFQTFLFVTFRAGYLCCLSPKANFCSSRLHVLFALLISTRNSELDPSASWSCWVGREFFLDCMVVRVIDRSVCLLLLFEMSLFWVLTDLLDKFYCTAHEFSFFKSIAASFCQERTKIFVISLLQSWLTLIIFPFQLFQSIPRPQSRFYLLISC